MQNIKIDGELVATIDPVVEGKAPNFSLPDLDGNLHELAKVDKPLLISVFPDINTRTCSLQTQRFNVEAATYTDIEFWSISNNSAEEQKNWCAAHGVDMTILADDDSFGEAYGLILPEGPLKGRLARSIFIVENGQITYHEIVNEITGEPDYAKALEMLVK